MVDVKAIKTLRIFLFVLIVIGVVLLLTRNFWVPKLVNIIISSDDKVETPFVASETPKAVKPISITTEKVKSENYTASYAVISGSTPLAKATRAYVDATIADFKKAADTEVPDIRKEFPGEMGELGTTTYEISIDAKYLKGDKTESVALNIYTYTGGAHGSSMYKVFTASLTDGKILALSTIVRTEQQNAFTEFVKKELRAWRPDGAAAPVIFEDQVKDLTFASFTNWAFDDKNLIIYFDQYDIGPGVLGATAFPIPTEKIKSFVQ